MDRNILVDGNNVLHRAYAVFVKDRTGEDVMTSPGGYPTGLTYGFLSMLADWTSSISRPTRMVLFLDGAPARRLALDPEYKFKEESSSPGREDRPVRLSDGFEARNELDVIIHVMGLMGVDLYHGMEEEADDLIASYVRSHFDDVCIVISSDRDFYQMLEWSDRIVLYRPGVKDNRFFDAERAEEDMLAKHKVRVPPSNVRMFKALTGDSSDGIVGIPRLRKKVAAPLCRFGSVEELYGSDFPGFSKAEREKAYSLRDRIRLNFELIGLNDRILLDPLLKKARPDFQVASMILKEDLGITTVYPHDFRFRQEGRAHFSQTTSYDLLPDFLKSI
jgi:5'-3' exonuclease